MEMLSWFELSKCKAGDRVCFPDGFDIYPIVYAPPGTTATVEEQGLNEIYHTMLVKPDDERVRGALLEWGGLIHLYGPEHPHDMREWMADSPVTLMAG